MEIDVGGKIGAVTRRIEERDHDGKPARVAIASRTYDTTPDDVWDAITNGERIPRWFLPVSGDLRLGGRYQLEGNAGGEIIRCDRPRHLGVTWEFGGEVSWLDVRLEPDPDGGTRLELEHVAYVDDERWAEYGPGAVGVGWDMTLLGLGEHLATGAAIDPQQALEWSMSSVGREYIRRSSDNWAEASIAAGTPEDAATAAAARTTAFYTGVGPDMEPDPPPVS